MQNMQQFQRRHREEIKAVFVNYQKDMLQQYGQSLSKTIIPFYKLNQQRKTIMFQQAIKHNQQFLNKIINFINESEQEENVKEQYVTSGKNKSKIKTTIKQFFREWCEQSKERKDYSKIVTKCKTYLKKDDLILVPGSGLGRLVLELVLAGFGAQGNEVTYFMLFGSNFILNCTEQKQQFKIFPFVHSANYYYDEEDMYRSVYVPDICASDLVMEEVNFSMAGGQFTQIYVKQEQKYDGVTTCFFLDTANNIFKYIDIIYTCLKPNGIWINLGPLLFHYRQIFNQISIEVSWQILRRYVALKFDFVEEQFQETTYCHDPLSKMGVVYNCVAFVCRKRK